MELQITGINIQITPVIRRYVERKMGRLNKHLPNIIESKVEISEEKTKSAQQRYLVRSTVASPGAAFHGDERGEDLFRAIDKLSAIMTRQLEHYKGKHYEQKKKGNPLARSAGNEATEAIETIETIEATETTEHVRKVVKVKHFALKPMTTTEAIEQMELMGHSFFLYFDAEVEEFKLLYRRKDGDYGLIEPEIGQNK